MKIILKTEKVWSKQVMTKSIYELYIKTDLFPKLHFYNPEKTLYSRGI